MSAFKRRRVDETSGDESHGDGSPLAFLGDESPLADRSLDDVTVEFLQRTVEERLVEPPPSEEAHTIAEAWRKEWDRLMAGYDATHVAARPGAATATTTPTTECLRGETAAAAASSNNHAPRAAEVHLCQGFLTDAECDALVALGRAAFRESPPPQWSPKFSGGGGIRRVAASGRVLTEEHLKVRVQEARAERQGGRGREGGTREGVCVCACVCVCVCVCACVCVRVCVSCCLADRISPLSASRTRRHNLACRSCVLLWMQHRSVCWERHPP